MHLAKPYLFVAILILAAGVGADEVAVPCNKDNTLYQDREGNISNGGGQHLFVEVDPKTAKRIFAREHATTSRRPVLHISFDRDAATAVELDSWGAIKAE